MVDPVLGFYGPDTQMWRINREAVLLGAGPAALLLQIADPLVAEAVAAHSAFETDPFGRLRRTLRTTMDIVFGDGPTAERAVRRLNEVHASIEGQVHDPDARQASGRSDYRALEPELLLWVQATLIITSVRAYRRWVGPLDATACERFWQEARRLGPRLGIPLRASPASFSELESWFAERLRPGGPIHVTPTALALAPAIIRPPVPLLPGALIDVAAAPGLAFLPARIREEFGIAWSRPTAAVAAAMHLAIRAWTGLMPGDWRAMPQARESARRCRRAGRGSPRQDAMAVG